MKTLLLTFALFCAGNACAQYHPYGDRDGPPPWPDSFGEKLHYLCSCRSTLYEPESTWEKDVIRECTRNYATIIEIQKLAAKDRYLARILGYVAQSDLGNDLKRERFAEAKARFGDSEWPTTTYQILNLFPDVLEKQEIQAFLDGKPSKSPDDRSNRLVAQRLLAKLAIEERMKPNVPEGPAPTGRTAPVDKYNRDGSQTAADHWKWSLMAGVILVLAAAAFIIWRRRANSTGRG